mmetsp:Transcript_22406/g.47320  ORF Transcript_22406/g.47320 Transcript_22406/m.47320 type:complete len:316 (+) Transcript_22406:351-1298(+)
MLGELVVHNLNITLSTHNDWTLGMDFTGNKVHNTLNFSLKHTSGGNSTGLLNNHCHRNSFVQKSKLSLGGFLVSGVQVDSSVKNGSVDISNHGTDVTGSVSILFVLEDFDGILDCLVPLRRVSFVTGVNLLSTIFREHHLHTSVDKLSNRAIKAESVDIASLESENHLYSRRVGNVSSADAVSSAAKHIFNSSVASRFAFIYTENSSNTDVAVDVRTSVKWVKSDTELSGLSTGNDDWFFVFLRNQDRADPRVNKSVDHHVVGKDIKLLLVVSSAVLFTRQPVKVGNSGALDSGCNELARSGNSVHQNDKVMVMG